MKSILKLTLKIITKLIIGKYNPYIIGITGSVGKTSTKEVLVSVLSHDFSVRGSAGNLNTEYGAPLVFFGEDKAGESSFQWLKIILKGIYLLLFRDPYYPQIIVSEMAADKPGDIGYLCTMIKPHIAIITAVGEVPVHVEFYKTAEQVAQEKEKLALCAKETAILCLDDPFVAKMGDGVTFGFKDGADVQIKDFQSTIQGSTFILSYKGEDSFFQIPLIGKPSAYSLAASFAVAKHLGVKEISTEGVSSPPGRLSLIPGKKDTLIIDGSYNSSPSSLSVALHCLRDLPGKRKIAVIGDMLELGDYSLEEHRKAGKRASSFCDYVLAVGKYSKEVSEKYNFSKSEEVIPFLVSIIEPGDLILIKGSQGIRTEKIVYEIMRDPQKAKDLLVRQSSFWEKR